MASRNRVHGSSLNRQKGPTKDHSARPRRERHEAETSPKRGERRTMYADKEPWNADPDAGYGSGKSAGKRSPRKEALKSPHSAALGPQPGGEVDDDFRRPHNNYDDYDRTYPGA